MFSKKFYKLTALFAIFIFFSISLSLLIKLNFHSVSAASSADAIAVRVIPNPGFYSARRWYQVQKFTGSPQSLIVDGYEAVRDGRTVYVNAANIDDKGTADPGDDELFTNIYLISYNQEAAQTTIDIFGQILTKWKFNTNIDDNRRCNISNTVACVSDDDCDKSEYCVSAKLNIIHDVRRNSDLAEIQVLLENYKKKNGRYPILKAGSYLSHISVSVWPS